MKYIISESQLRNSIDHLKEPMFKYWDINGSKNLSVAMKLFTIPLAAETLVEEWLLEWMGGKDKVRKMLKKYERKEFRAVVGSYDFKCYVNNVRIYTHGGVDIYFDAVVDGNGKVHIEGPGFTINTVYQAHMNENFGWEVDDEIRDTIRDILDEAIDIEFPIKVDHISVTEPDMFNI